jgi:hypothetical protein
MNYELPTADCLLLIACPLLSAREQGRTVSKMR